MGVKVWSGTAHRAGASAGGRLRRGGADDIMRFLQREGCTMKGLLYKEWATLISSYKQSVFFFAFLYGGISILTGQTGMAYGLLVVFSILITSTISFDENSHWDIYARTLPVTPAQLVGSKYLFGLCGLALGTVYTVLIVALNNVLPPPAVPAHCV